MNVKFYAPEEGFSKRQVDSGQMWVFADVTCPSCGKVQPVAATHYVGGPCVACGDSTGATP